MLEQARNLTPALSAAAAICDHMRYWLLGTPEGEWTSMGVVSDGSYDVPEGLIFSFPVTCQDGEWQIVQVRSMLPPGNRARFWDWALSCIPWVENTELQPQLNSTWIVGR